MYFPRGLVVALLSYIELASFFPGHSGAETAEYKPQPQFICILASTTVLYFHIDSDSTTMAAEMRHAHSRIVIKAARKDPSPPTIELRKTRPPYVRPFVTRD